MAYTTIDDPSAHFQVDKYTADNTSDTVTFDGNSNLKPDLIWVKSIDTAYNAQFHDSSRGATAGAMYTNLSDAEDSTYHVDNFLTDGYINDSVNTAIHANGETIMSYGWKANGGTTTNLSANINSVAQANTTARFSIVTYTGNGSVGQSVAHGLGVTPEFILVKRRDGNADWFVYHQTLGNTKHLHLNTTAAESTTSDWANYGPNATYFYVNNTGPNVNTETYLAYCWAGVQGYSKFGRYEGNGQSNGTFIVTGFKPAWIMVKNTESTESWVIYNDEMPGYNQVGQKIAPNLQDDQIPSGIGGPGYNDIDIYSNGFKYRTNNAATNENDADFIYAAFAKEPFVTSGGVPATAV